MAARYAFWIFAMVFFGSMAALAAYCHETAIAMLASFFLGVTFEQFRRTPFGATQ